MVVSWVKSVGSVSFIKLDRETSCVVGLTVIELLVNTASAGDDIVTEQDGVDVVVGAEGGGVVDVWTR